MIWRNEAMSERVRVNGEGETSSNGNVRSSKICFKLNFLEKKFRRWKRDVGGEEGGGEKEDGEG